MCGRRYSCRSVTFPLRGHWELHTVFEHRNGTWLPLFREYNGIHLAQVPCFIKGRDRYPCKPLQQPQKPQKPWNCEGFYREDCEVLRGASAERHDHSDFGDPSRAMLAFSSLTWTNCDNRWIRWTGTTKSSSKRWRKYLALSKLAMHTSVTRHPFFKFLD